MKFVEPRPYADPAVAARKIMEICNGIDGSDKGRLHTEKINGPMLYEFKASPAEYKAGLDYAIDRGWLESRDGAGFWFYFTQSGKDLFA